MLTYQIREFVKGDTTIFEVWRCRTVGRRWLSPRKVWEKLAELPTYNAAEAFISAEAGGYYRTIHDYDQCGKPVIYVW